MEYYYYSMVTITTRLPSTGGGLVIENYCYSMFTITTRFPSTGGGWLVMEYYYYSMVTITTRLLSTLVFGDGMLTLHTTLLLSLQGYTVQLLDD